jgi:hypothetical protein
MGGWALGLAGVSASVLRHCLRKYVYEVGDGALGDLVSRRKQLLANRPDDGDDDDDDPDPVDTPLAQLVLGQAKAGVGGGTRSTQLVRSLGTCFRTSTALPGLDLPTCQNLGTRCGFMALPASPIAALYYLPSLSDAF